jgi:hypothetical protein
MTLIPRIIFVILAAALVGGTIFLANWDIPAPSAPIEKVIPNDRVLR